MTWELRKLPWENCSKRIKIENKKTLRLLLKRICQRVLATPKTSMRLQGPEPLDNISRNIKFRLLCGNLPASKGKPQRSTSSLRAIRANGTEPLKAMILTRPRYWQVRLCHCLQVIRCALVILPMVLVLLKSRTILLRQASSATFVSISSNFDLFLNKRLALMVLSKFSMERQRSCSSAILRTRESYSTGRSRGRCTRRLRKSWTKSSRKTCLISTLWRCSPRKCRTCSTRTTVSSSLTANTLSSAMSSGCSIRIWHRSWIPKLSSSKFFSRCKVLRCSSRCRHRRAWRIQIR